MALGVAVGVTDGVEVAVAVGVGVTLGVTVAVAVAVAVAVGVAVAVAVAVGVGVGVPAPHGVALGTGLGATVGVGGGAPTAAAILTRPQPYTLFGGPAGPHVVSEIKCAALSKASRLAWIWFCKLGIADHNSAMAPAMCGVAMDVPLAVV